MRAAEFLPVVDQVETHVLYQQRRLARLLDPHGIRIEAWSPLGAGDPVPLAHPVLVRIARDHGAAPAQVDLRIKSLVNVSVIDISASYLTPHPDAQAHRAALAGPGRAALPGPRLAVPGDGGHGLPITLSDDNPMGEFGALYWCEAGHHHSPTTQLAAVPDLSFMSFPELTHPERIETPVLTVVGEQAATRPLSEAIHERLTTTKRIVVAPGAGHVDLYHRTDHPI